MEQPNRERKGEIKYQITLNAEQKIAKAAIWDNQLVILTGASGSGKTTVNAQCALDLLNKKMCNRIFISRPTVEVGKSLGFLPGGLTDKLDPYFEAFMECVENCLKDKAAFEKVKDKFIYLPIQFIRGRTINDYLFLDEAQNTNISEMEAILTRLGKDGKIVVCGDLAQKDTNINHDGLTFAIELSKRITEIKHIKLETNHRSELVKRILDVKNSLTWTK
jgi:phosphate starvation-inducible PhoH-like protein